MAPAICHLFQFIKQVPSDLCESVACASTKLHTNAEQERLISNIGGAQRGKETIGRMLPDDQEIRQIDRDEYTRSPTEIRS